MLKRINSRLKHIRWLFGFFKGNCKVLPAFAVLEGILPIGAVYCSKTLLQKLIDNKGIMELMWWVLVVVGLQLLSKIVLHYRTIWVKAQLSGIKYECMKNIALTYGKADLAEAESENMIKGKESAINSIDFNDSIKNMIDAICIFISGLVMLIGCVGVIADLNAILIIVVIVSFVPQFMINKRKKNFDFSNMKKWIELNRETNCYSSLLTELKSIKEIQLYSAENLVHDKIEEIDNKRTNEMEKQERYHTFLDLCFFLVKAINDAIIYGYLVIKLLKGYILIPEFSLYIGGINYLSKAVENITGSYISMKQYVNYLDIYYDFTCENYESDLSEQEIEERPLIEKIEFINVSFRYPGQERDALEDISVVLHKNEHISLVGRNGAGKTTFVKLLLGLYHPSKGEIRINGINIDEFTREELNRMYSVLFQDYNIFPLSVYENVTLQEKREGSRDIKNLYASVGLQNRLEKLKEYDDTIVSNFSADGVAFSGGEKLRLAIARVINRDTSAIVLDEPSSALDPKAEYEFYQMIKKMSDNKTVIFVSHRMSSSKFSSRILVFNESHLVGDGKHEFLHNSNDFYRSLYDAQAIVE